MNSTIEKTNINQYMILSYIIYNNYYFSIYSCICIADVDILITGRTG